MRKLLMALIFPSLALPSSAFAQVGYSEGSIGFALLSDADTDDFSALTQDGVFEGSAQLEYNSQWTAGLEAGFMTDPWRFGFSWDYFRS
jgi:opacity protein-like surface antigen